MAVRIIAIRKDNGNHYSPYEAVSHYKWINEDTLENSITARPDMVRWVESGGRAYVRGTSTIADCYVNKSNAGTKFLQTDADNNDDNNLLNLPPC